MLINNFETLKRTINIHIFLLLNKGGLFMRDYCWTFFSRVNLVEFVKKERKKGTERMGKGIRSQTSLG